MLRDYPVSMYYDSKKEYFVAYVPSIPSCAADGATTASAIANLEETFAVLKESYLEEGMEFPSPTPTAGFQVTAETLKRIQKTVKIAAIAAKADIPAQTLVTKIRRGTAFTVVESQRLERAIRDEILAPLHVLA